MTKMNIEYKVKDGSYDVSSDLTKFGQYEVLEAYIRVQMGQGEDKRKPEKRKKYAIQVRWNPDGDVIGVKSNTGNDGLTCGILMGLYQKLSAELED